MQKKESVIEFIIFSVSAYIYMMYRVHLLGERLYIYDV